MMGKGDMSDPIQTKEWKVGDAVSWGISGLGVIVGIQESVVELWCWGPGEYDNPGLEWNHHAQRYPTSILRPWPTDTPQRQEDYARAMRLAPDAVREAREQ